MDDDRTVRQPTNSSRGPSRALVIAVLALLIGVAIAGIMLARNRASTTVATLRAAASVPGAPAVPAFTLAYAGGNDVPASSVEGLARFAKAAAKAPGKVEALAVIDHPFDEPIARIRLVNLQQALEAQGVTRDRFKVTVALKAKAAVKPGETDRVTLSVH